MRINDTHFDWEDVTRTEHRDIGNSLPDTMRLNVETQAEGMERVRHYANRNQPVVISSWYRSPALNAAVGGSPSSDHSFALACDCRSLTQPVTEFFISIVQSRDDINFRQVIWEYGRWVHVAFDAVGAGQKIITPNNRVIVIRTKAEGYLPYTEGMTL